MKRTDPEYREYTKMISVDELQIDTDPSTKYQRDKTGLVAEIVAHFKPSALGEVTVSKRADGKYYIVDGQHRWLASKQVGHRMLRCRVHEGLSTAEEAGLFHELNHKKTVRAWTDFRSQVLSGDQEAVAIEKCFAARGVSIIGSGCTASVSAQWIFNGCGGATEPGTAALNWALDVYLKAWPAPKNPRQWVDGQVLSAIAAIYVRHGDECDASDLVKKLTKTSAAALIGYARTMNSAGGAVWNRIAWNIVQTYNSGRRSRHLPPWDMSIKGKASRRRDSLAKKAA